MQPDHSTQHVISVAALTVPSASFWATHNPELTGVLTVMGIFWYAYLGVREIQKWRKRHKWPSNH